MPDVDSVNVLQEYARDNGIVAGKWHLLTGDKEVHLQAGARFLFCGKQSRGPAKSGEFLHTESMLLIDGEGASAASTTRNGTAGCRARHRTFLLTG